MRLTNEQLQKIKDKYGVNELWSYSKISTFQNSTYEYYLRYVLGKKSDRNDSAYAPCGGFIHQCIEDYYGGKISYEDMIVNFEDAWTTYIDIVGLKFDRTNEEKNENIKRKYRESLNHFFKNLTKLQKKSRTRKVSCY